MKLKGMLISCILVLPLITKTADLNKEHIEYKVQHLSSREIKKSSCPWALLKESIARGDLTNFCNILEANFDLLNYQGKPFGVSALMVACVEGKPKIVKKLIDLKANMNLIDDLNENALIIAAKNDYPDILEMLLDAGADTTDPSGKGSFYENIDIADVSERVGELLKKRFK